MRGSPVRSVTTWALATLLVFGTARCSDSTAPAKPDPSGGTTSCGSAKDLASCLPGWNQFAPPQASEQPTPAGSPTTSEKVDSLQQIDSTGKLVSLGNVTFECTDSTFNFVDNPGRALSFNIDQTVVWPGALIQGKSHRDAHTMNDLLELPVRERTPVTVTLSFNNADNTATVTNPDQGSVNQAVQTLIGKAQAGSLVTASNIDFDEKTFSSEQQAALAFGVSGRYLSFEATAKGGVSKSVSRHEVVAQFKQQMYIAGVTQPATPADFFSADFTADKYQAQANLGRIGANNPPLYVSRIGYGRMMVFEMSANAQASEIEHALNAAYKGIGSGASVSLSAQDSSVLSRSELRVSQIGGADSNALAAIHSGNLADYFTSSPPLTSAAPLWFELKTLTGEVAQVSEPGTYTQTTCVPKLPGSFAFLPSQTLAIPFAAGTQRRTLQADVNGDGKMDLVFDELQSSPSRNIVHVALANGDGTFSIQPPDSSLDAPAEGWENFTLSAVHLTGGARADLVWNALTTSDNVVYAAVSNGNGSFSWRPRQELPAGGWNTYRMVTGDINGDGRTDLVWTNAGKSSAGVRTYFGLAQADTSFAMVRNYVDQAGDFSGFETVAAVQLDGVGGADLLFSDLSASNNTARGDLFTPTSDTTGTLALQSALAYNISGWGNYITRIGDIDGRNGADLVFVRGHDAGNTNGWIHRALNTGHGTFSVQTVQHANMNTAPVIPYLADFNNDGRDDILLNHRDGSTNDVLVGFGTSNGTFTFPAGVQSDLDVPPEGWAAYDLVFVGDINGDGKADVVWTNPSSETHIYVALAK